MKPVLAGVVGDPVAQSLSPRLHGFWLAAYGIEGAYVRLPVGRENLSQVLGALRLAGFAGVNITIPHKEAAFALAARADAAATVAQAANLLRFEEDGTISASNTDVFGLVASLSDSLGANVIRDKPALILGAGGAARAAVLALVELGASQIAVLNRSSGRAKTLVSSLQPAIAAPLIGEGLGAWPLLAADVALIVQCTSAGMLDGPGLGLDLAALNPAAVVCDIVTKPLYTALLRQAAARGHRTVDGLGMLMYQAVPSFEAFFGLRPAVTAALRSELEGALDGR